MKKILLLLSISTALLLSSCGKSNGLPGDVVGNSATTATRDTANTPAVESTLPVDIWQETSDMPVTIPPDTEPPTVSAGTFKADLSAYEPYFEPAVRDDYIMLINKDHLLASDYVPADLVDIVDTRKDGRDIQQMREIPEKALEGFLIEARANGVDVTVTSGYRDYNKQKYLLDQQTASFVAQYGAGAETEALKWVALPGSSEHQSGLCADMHNLSAANTKFAETEEAKWLMANCHRFGFIVRYTEEKFDYTGISFEPWHYRYVGRYHATKMHDLGMCLEEYTDYLAKQG